MPISTVITAATVVERFDETERKASLRKSRVRGIYRVALT
jgi:hypothetical protein